MSAARANPGSFRDPGSGVFELGDRIVRTVWPSSAGAYEAVRDSGLLADLVKQGKLVASREIDPASVELETPPAYLLEHPRLPFISYPYEWPFALLKKAALFHLDLQLEALEAGFALSDATAYNVQFEGIRPVLIDHLSLRPYVDGEIWEGHRQFCMQFLNPIVLWSRKGVSPLNWFRGSLEGISPEDTARLLSWRDNLSWTILSHVTAQSAAQRRAIRTGASIAPQARPRLSKVAFKGMLQGLRGFIAKCRAPDQTTVWDDYEHNNSYDREQAEAKRAFVSEAIAAHRPRLVADLGCNSGAYSELALASGASRAIGFDYDFGALEAAVVRAETAKLDFLPLWLDAANPSPSQGWAQAERPGLAERLKADFVIALAFVHHIAIGRNVPLAMVVDWLIGLAPVGVIEFPSKADPMVQRLLANRTDIFPDYTPEHFLALVAERAQVRETKAVCDGGRLLVSFERSS
jgi:ribosomal protein L11 methylase PrmA